MYDYIRHSHLYTSVDGYFALLIQPISLDHITWLKLEHSTIH